MRNPTSAVLGAVKRRKRSVASVVSVAAIGTLALGTLGTGVATAHGMVDSERIQNQTIQTQDIGQNGVGASEVGPNAIHKWNINQNSVGLYELNDYARNNLEGDKGEPGEDGVSGLVIPTDTRTVPANSGRSWYGTECPEGTNAIAGGYSGDGVQVTTDKPWWGTEDDDSETRHSSDPNRAIGWNVGASNSSDEDSEVTIWAVCASVN